MVQVWSEVPVCCCKAWTFGEDLTVHWSGRLHDVSLAATGELCVHASGRMNWNGPSISFHFETAMPAAGERGRTMTWSLYLIPFRRALFKFVPETKPKSLGGWWQWRPDF